MKLKCIVFISVLFSIIAAESCFLFESKKSELSHIEKSELCQSKLSFIQEKAEMADKIVMTCLSQQSVVRWELEVLSDEIRKQHCEVQYGK